MILKDQKFLFSLVIPVYGVEPYVRKCLDSILQQGYKNWEAILVDDGSKDKSGEICDEYAIRDSRFQVIHQENGGVSRARNIGLDIARGEWVWFVDPDDWLKEDALEILAKAVSSTNCDVVIFGIEYYNEDLKLIGLENRPNIIRKPKDETIEKGDYPPQNYLVRREIVQKYNLRYSPGISMGEDLEFQYKCLMLSKTPISINHRLYGCLRRQGSAMRNENSLINSANCSIIVLEHLVDFIIKHNIKETSWLSARMNRTFKNVLSSNARVGRYCQKLQSSFNDSYVKLRKYGFSEFADSAVKIGRIDIRLYSYLLRVINMIRK